MSDALAVAAVTETLRATLQAAARRAAPDAVVTTRHPGAPDLAVADEDDGGDGAGGRTPTLNVFLYRTSVDTAWRNTDPPGTRPGETRHPALPLVLHYLFTAYAPRGADSTLPERLLGAAMSALHDQPVLRAEVLRAAADFSDLHRQPEAVRLTPAVMPADEMWRLWTALGHGYRLSVAYEARVVLLDSSTPGRTPLPVLSRGSAGLGPQAAPTPSDPWPVLRSVLPAVAPPGAEVVLSGSGLGPGEATVRLTHPLLGGPVVLPARSDGNATVRVTLDGELAAGRWSAVVVLSSPEGGDRTTAPLALHIAPRLTGALPLTITRAANGATVLSVECAPAVQPGQRAELLVADLPVPAEPFTRATRKLRFRLSGGLPGRYPLRLRVDGVDSPLADARAERFDADAAVVIT
ncbi:DUF4255 domain-containing protein [Streptomyces sp. NPDC054884]|uniref:DUF4255 domain-containing protein n=1 Tax=Streptomyces sp. ME08-AFT2 TaxID=3028683 RepID=UPI0029B13A50|nr:DUF4255 domain-containing protein [Streptomyces sp. ME08-AFT2]MDX3310056.1 DUF4255 domain-containing protein [Streptomyces sp. ME08-AFT2]